MSDHSMITYSPSTGNPDADQRLVDQYGANTQDYCSAVTSLNSDFMEAEASSNELAESLFLIQHAPAAQLGPILRLRVREILVLGHPDAQEFYAYIAQQLEALCDSATLLPPASRADLDSFRVTFMTKLKDSIDQPSAVYLSKCAHVLPLTTVELRGLLYLAVALLHREHPDELIAPYETDRGSSPFVEAGFPMCAISFSAPNAVPPGLMHAHHDAEQSLATLLSLGNDTGANKRFRASAPPAATPTGMVAPRLPRAPAPDSLCFAPTEAEDAMEEDDEDGGGPWQTQNSNRSGPMPGVSFAEPAPSSGQVRAGLAKSSPKVVEGFSPRMQQLAKQAGLSLHPSRYLSVAACHGSAMVYVLDATGDYPDKEQVLVVLADITLLMSVTQALTQPQFDYPNATYQWLSPSGDRAQQRLTVRLYGLPSNLTSTRLEMWWRYLFGDASYIQARQIAQGTDEGKAAPCWEVQFWRGSNQVFARTDVSNEPVCFPPLNGPVRFYPVYNFAWHVGVPWRRVSLRLKGLNPESSPAVFKDEAIALLTSVLESIGTDQPILPSQFVAFDHREGALTLALSTRLQANALIEYGLSLDGIPISTAIIYPPVTETITRGRFVVKLLVSLDADRALTLPVLQSLALSSLQSSFTPSSETPEVVAILAIKPDSWADVALFQVSFRKAAMAAAALATTTHREIRYFANGCAQTIRMTVLPWERRPDPGGRSLSRGAPPDRGRRNSRSRSRGRPAGNSQGRPANAGPQNSAPAQNIPSVNQALGRVASFNAPAAQRTVDLLVHLHGAAAVMAMVNSAPGPLAPTPSVTRALAISSKQQSATNAQPRTKIAQNAASVPAPSAAPKPTTPIIIAPKPKPKTTPQAGPGPHAITGRGRGRQGQRLPGTHNVQPPASGSRPPVSTQWATTPAPFQPEDEYETPSFPPPPPTTYTRDYGASTASKPRPTLEELGDFMMRMNTTINALAAKVGVEPTSTGDIDLGNQQSKNA